MLCVILVRSGVRCDKADAYVSQLPVPLLRRKITRMRTFRRGRLLLSLMSRPGRYELLLSPGFRQLTTLQRAIEVFNITETTIPHRKPVPDEEKFPQYNGNSRGRRADTPSEDEDEEVELSQADADAIGDEEDED